jgi:hypothetical protein
VDCVNCKGENVVTTNLNLIHFFNIQSCKTGLKMNFICNFCKEIPELPAN